MLNINISWLALLIKPNQGKKEKNTTQIRCTLSLQGLQGKEFI